MGHIRRLNKLDEKKTYIITLYGIGQLSPAQIAKKMGCSTNTIVNRLKEWGVPTRDRSAAGVIRERGKWNT